MIEIIVDDGLEVAKRFEDSFDYILLDAAKGQNLPIMKALLPKLNVGAVVLTDNAVTHADEMFDFFDFVRHHPELASGLMEIGNGIEVTIKLAERLSPTVVPGDR